VLQLTVCVISKNTKRRYVCSKNGIKLFATLTVTPISDSHTHKLAKSPHLHMILVAG